LLLAETVWSREIDFKLNIQVAETHRVLVEGHSFVGYGLDLIYG
jgi:hypothetical protein